MVCVTNLPYKIDMVIHSNLTPDAASLQNSPTTAKNSQRAATTSETTPNQPASDINSAALVLDSQDLSVTAGSEIQDPEAADQSLSFLQNAISNQPALALSAQANQIPASVLQLLQP
jgi:hypothetical protein